MKHTGLNTHRLASNPREMVFAKLWEDQNKRGDTLAWILNSFDSNDLQRKGPVSERDAQVAATVIQWLGSPVGQAFLEQASEEQRGLDHPN